MDENGLIPERLREAISEVTSSVKHSVHLLVFLQNVVF